jgi:predicted enzyme related to lactoylglutathione lyase
METAVGVSNISVVYLYVRDMERSLAFYRDLLGIPLEGDGHWTEATFPGGADVGETMRKDWGTAVDVVDPDGYTITLFQRPG